MKTERLQIRCPVNPSKLLAVMLKEGEEPSLGLSSLLELKCQDCSRLARRHDSTVTLVVHRYDLHGKAVETQAIHKSP